MRTPMYVRTSAGSRRCTWTRRPRRRRALGGRDTWSTRELAYRCWWGRGSPRISAAETWLTTASEQTARCSRRAITIGGAGFAAGVQKPGMTWTNSSDASRRGWTPLSRSSDRCSRLCGEGTIGVP